MGNTVGRQNYISKQQQELIIGCLLGDGRLESRSLKGSARLRIHHGVAQKELVFWKYKILQDLVSSPPQRIVCGRSPRKDKRYYSWYFHTRTLPEFRNYHDMFYANGEKVLPNKIEELLSPFSLAVWIMDDGCKNQGSLVLNTQNFSLEEHSIIKNVFSSKFGLISGVNKDRNGFRLRFFKSGFNKISRIVKPYIIPSMEYKILSP